MPFGLKGAPAKFQTSCSQNTPTYPPIDDVAVYSTTHLQHVQAGLKLLRLTVKVKKCKFAQREVSFLGHTVGGGKVKTHEAKQSWRCTKKELQASSALLYIIENLLKDTQPLLLVYLTSPGRSYLKSYNEHLSISKPLRG